MQKQRLHHAMGPIKQNKEVELCGRIHSDICNVHQHLLPSVRLQLKFTSFYLLNKDADSKTVFKFLDAFLLVNRVKTFPTITLAHIATLPKGPLARYNLTRVEQKTSTFSSGAQSLSIDNAVLGLVPKRMLFTVVKNTDFLGSVNTNTYFFRHYDLSYFALKVNGKQIPTEDLALNMGHEKTYVTGYRTLFESSGINHSNS